MSCATFETMTIAQATTIAVAHIQRYSNMIRSGGRGVRIDECRTYLAIWQDTLDTLRQSDDPNWKTRLKERELGELHNAIDCGDYDDLLWVQS